MAYSDPSVSVASAARTVTGNSAALLLREKGEILNLLVNVTAASGTTPSLALTVEWSHDGTNFAQGDTADTFAAITTTSAKAKGFSIKAPFYRVVWTLTGTTPSFTFSVSDYITHA